MLTTPDHNIVVFPLHTGDGPLLQAVPDTKKTRRKLASKNVAIGMRHFTIEEHLGSNSILHCWCGAPDSALALDYTTYSVDDMSANLSKFVNDHAECVAQGMDR